MSGRNGSEAQPWDSVRERQREMTYAGSIVLAVLVLTGVSAAVFEPRVAPYVTSIVLAALPCLTALFRVSIRAHERTALSDLSALARKDPPS